MDALDLARWQFGITTVYHFLFVPITIGMAWLVAGMQTAWHRTGNLKYLRLTKFFGKLFLINFAMGVVTGIVQEFQFGMNWSTYSRFVGDIFGAPLAMEGLMAFFLESTFIGLWIFGWDRLPKRIHLATIWAAAFGTTLSAYFILAANAFMQHPNGYEVVDGRARLTNIWSVLFQNTAVIAFLHTIAACLLTAGALMAGIAAWRMVRHGDGDLMRPAVKTGAIVAVVAGVALMITGDQDAKIMTQQQPMKMAAAEALYETQANAPFSVLSIGNLQGTEAKRIIEIPGLLSFLATGSFDGTVEGINNLQAQYEQTYGPGNYVPYVPITYWGFRLMMGLGALASIFGLVTLWVFRRGRQPRSAWYAGVASLIVLFPLLGNSFGWIFTEMGRQPWIVFGLQKTADANSPAVGAGEVWITLVGFTLIYAALAAVMVSLFVKTAKAGAPEEAALDPEPFDPDAPADKPLYFAY